MNIASDSTPSELTSSDMIALVNAMARHDQSALSSLYSATAGRVQAYVQSITRNSADTEEVLCDVYWQVWQQASEYSSERGPVGAWLMMIARTRALDKTRRRQSKVMKQDCEFDMTELMAPDESPDLAILSVQHSEYIADALHRLPETQSTLIRKSFYEDLTHQELADYFDLPLGTVKSHIRRGLLSLREHLSVLSPA